MTNGHSADVHNSKSDIVDDPEVLRRQREIEKQKQQQPILNHVITSSAAVGAAEHVSLPTVAIASTVNSNQQRQKQIETRTKDGRRRIEPVCLGSTLDAANIDTTPSSLLSPLPPLTWYIIIDLFAIIHRSLSAMMATICRPLQQQQRQVLHVRNNRCKRLVSVLHRQCEYTRLYSDSNHFNFSFFI